MKIKKINNRKQKYFLYALGICILLLAIIKMTASVAKYKISQSIKIVEGKVSYKLGDLNLMAIYVENDNGYEQIEMVPESGYILNQSESSCLVNGVKDTNINISYDNGIVSFSSLKKGTRCYLYFDKLPVASETILAQKTINTRSDFNIIITTSSTGVVYQTLDDDGESYYFAGSPTDNWVKFANLYWRIIRINGDGTIRLIYNGTSTATSGDGTQIGTSKFNTPYFDTAYIGYMYTLGSLRGTSTSSTIKETIDSWYVSNLTNYSNYIDTNAGFCGDRTPSTSNTTINNSGGLDYAITYYGDYIRYYNNGNPTLKCAHTEDLYTKNESIKGNKALTYPVGLINMNEVWLAGGYHSNNTSYYLYTGKNYWTMSPSDFYDVGADLFQVNSKGYLTNYAYAGESYGVRPVINLKANTQFKKGTLGTLEYPYEVF